MHRFGPMSFRRIIACSALLSALEMRAQAESGGRAESSVAAASGPVREQTELREMTTDRPDSTESPFTVNPGHVQLEMDAVSYARDREDGARTEEWEAAAFNVRFGLTENFEAGIFVTPFRRVSETPAGGPRHRLTGVGDTMLRGKWNVRGNDGGDFAWGVMADLKAPTAREGLSNDEWEGALTFPMAFELGGGWGGGAMTAVEIVFTDAGRHEPVWVNTFTASRDLTENVGGFLELTSAAGDGAHVATFNAGLTRKLSENAQLDCGVNLGLSRAAPDLLVFAGLSRRW